MILEEGSILAAIASTKALVIHLGDRRESQFGCYRQHCRALGTYCPLETKSAYMSLNRGLCV